MGFLSFITVFCMDFGIGIVRAYWLVLFLYWHMLSWILIPVPRHARQCNTVAWNPVDSNLIAAGLDRYKADHSVLLWDVLKCPHHGDRRTIVVPSVSHQHPAASTPLELARPVAELGLSETTHSLAWFNSQSRSLVIGMNNKHLKLVDLRGILVKFVMFLSHLLLRNYMHMELWTLQITSASNDLCCNW